MPLLYFLEGVPYVITTGLSALMFKSFALARPELGIGNDRIALFTSLITIPWMLKMLWGPMVDLNATKRTWIVGTQILLVVLLLAFAYSATLPQFFTVGLVVLLGLAFISATHDIAADGFYLLALGQRAQAFFVGIRSTFYRLATIFGSGLLVAIAGQLERIGDGPYLMKPDGATEMDAAGNPVRLDGFQQWLQRLDVGAAGWIPDATARAWTLTLGMGALVFLALAAVNWWVLPRPAADRPAVARQSVGEVPFWQAFSAFFRQDKIAWILGFIVFYRFGESLIGKVSPLFLRDPLEQGGLGLATDQIGLLTGTWGVLALTVGGLLGGFAISRWGIKRCLWPMVLSLNIPNLAYVWAAMTQVQDTGQLAALIGIDQFGYGFGFSAYMVYLMFVSRGTAFPTSSYAVATGLMALGALVAQSISGYLQVQLGYVAFFVAVCLLGIPGIITLFFIPLKGEDVYEPVEVD